MAGQYPLCIRSALSEQAQDTDLAAKKLVATKNWSVSLILRFIF